MKITTMYRPDDAEEANGLVARTVRELLEDYRVAEMLAGEVIPPVAVKPDHESPVEFVLRFYRQTLPTNHAADVLHLRCLYGWTRDEVELIVSMVNEGVILYCRQVEDSMLGGLVESLGREAEKLERLRNEWQSLID